MINIITDLQMINAVVELNQRDSSKNRIHVNFYYQQFYQKNNIDSSILSENFKYYSAYPETINEIYDSVIVRLSEYESQNQAMLPK